MYLYILLQIKSYLHFRCLHQLKQQIRNLQRQSNFLPPMYIPNPSESSTCDTYSASSVHFTESGHSVLNPSEMNFSDYDDESTVHNETRHSIIFSNKSFLADSVLNPFEYEKAMQASLGITTSNTRANPPNQLFEQSNGKHYLTEQNYDNYEKYETVSNIYELPTSKKRFSGILKNLKKAAQSFVKKKSNKNSKVHANSGADFNPNTYNTERSLPPIPLEKDSENDFENMSNSSFYDTSLTDECLVYEDVHSEYLFQTYFSRMDKQDAYNQDDS